MERISLTPFGRQPMTARLISAQQQAAQAPALPRIDKWALLTELRTGRAAFGITDRDLVVLNALLSFLPARDLDQDAALIVFPSNAALSERAHGMAESTLRRHLAVLVNAGLLRRQDSPNGKRYMRRAGGDQVAFGFDLRPLLVRADEIARASADAVEAAEALKRKREALVLRLRDAGKLVAYGLDEGLPGDWAGLEARLVPLRRILRRKMADNPLSEALAEIGQILKVLAAMLRLATEDMNGTAAQNGRHYQNSNKESYDFEPSLEQEERAGSDAPEPESDVPAIPLGLVLKACPDIVPYSRGNLQTWRDLIATAGDVRSMMGISPSAWEEAQTHMGPENAAIAVSALLQRYEKIKSPGGYLRALSEKAATGGFSPGPMIMALLRAS